MALVILRIRDTIKKQKNFVPSPHSQAKRKLSSFQILSCSSKNPTHRDCTNQILEYMEEINLDLEFQDIANKPNMSKDKFKILIKEKFKNRHSGSYWRKNQVELQKTLGINISNMKNFLCKNISQKLM